MFTCRYEDMTDVFEPPPKLFNGAKHACVTGDSILTNHPCLHEVDFSLRGAYLELQFKETLALLHSGGRLT
jgi:hypothetical protein